jgi:hypothetical protein
VCGFEKKNETGEENGVHSFFVVSKGREKQLIDIEGKETKQNCFYVTTNSTARCRIGE